MAKHGKMMRLLFINKHVHVVKTCHITFSMLSHMSKDNPFTCHREPINRAFTSRENIPQKREGAFDEDHCPYYIF